MTAKLTLVEPGDSPFINVLLYGPPKAGKSVGAASAPGSLLLLNADRPNASRMAHRFYGDRITEARFEGLETLIAATDIAQRDDSVQSLVLDTVADAYRTLLEESSGRSLHPTLQQYGDTGTHLERFCRAMCEAPVNFVVVAHETSVKDEETGGFERLPYTGTNNPALGAKLMAMVDVIGYCGVVPAEKPDEEPRYMAQLVNGRGRRGGDRFGVLGEARPINLSEWVDLAHSGIQPEQTGDTKQEAAA